MRWPIQHVDRLGPPAVAGVADLLAELSDVLHKVVRKRRSGTITVEDLPAQCRSGSRRQLTPLENLERDAIVASLTATDFNKAKAAAEVGMSRQRSTARSGSTAFMIRRTPEGPDEDHSSQAEGPCYPWRRPQRSPASFVPRVCGK